MPSDEFNKAVEEVLRLKARVGTMPTKFDYEELGIDTDALAKALGVKKSMKKLGTPAYAAINIAVLRELRRRRGEVVMISETDEKHQFGRTTYRQKIID